MLRTATARPAAPFITLTGDRYRLNPALTDVDLWNFDAALARAQAAAGQDQQLTALRQAADLYRGPADQFGPDPVAGYRAVSRVQQAYPQLIEGDGPVRQALGQVRGVQGQRLRPGS